MNVNFGNALCQTLLTCEVTNGVKKKKKTKSRVQKDKDVAFSFNMLIFLAISYFI